MGYSTDFKGELRFTKELTASQLAAVKAFMGEDCREHPEWGTKGLYYIDLELTDDFGGIKWSGAEKTAGMVECVNLIIAQMRKRWPDFGLEGTLSAQGERAEDRWALIIENGLAQKRAIVVTGQRVTCPNCDHTFILEDGKP